MLYGCFVQWLEVVQKVQIRSILLCETLPMDRDKLCISLLYAVVWLFIFNHRVTLNETTDNQRVIVHYKQVYTFHELNFFIRLLIMS
jgi:hypothetical protein